MLQAAQGCPSVELAIEVIALILENVADIAAEDEGVALEYEIAKEVCKTTYDYGMEFYKFNHKNEELHNARWSIDFFLNFENTNNLVYVPFWSKPPLTPFLPPPSKKKALLCFYSAYKTRFPEGGYPPSGGVLRMDFP